MKIKNIIYLKYLYLKFKIKYLKCIKNFILFLEDNG